MVAVETGETLGYAEIDPEILEQLGAPPLNFSVSRPPSAVSEFSLTL